MDKLETIYLEGSCGSQSHEGRQWCSDPIFEKCEECDCAGPEKYLRASIVEQELTSLREEGMKDRYALRRAVEMLEAEQNIAKELRQAVVDFCEIAQVSKPNCGPKLRALIQAAQEKHSALIDRARKEAEK